MVSKRNILSSIYAAYSARSRHGFSLEAAIDPIELISREGLETRYIAGPSLEGAYISNTVPPSILLTSLRPRGRKAFTASHEFGHHLLGHGTRIDEYVNEANSECMSEEEQMADAFAGALLMPELAVYKQAAIRGYKLGDLTRHEAYKLSCQFGVGYSTLVNQLCFGYHILSHDQRETLNSVRPKQIKAELGMNADGGECVWVDQHWNGISIDLNIGDTLLSETSLLHHPLLSIQGSSDAEAEPFKYKATKSGVSQVSSICGWQAFLRVSPPAFEGRAMYRFLPEEE